MGKPKKKPKKQTEMTKPGAVDSSHPSWWCHKLGHPTWCGAVHHENDVDRDCRSSWSRSVLLTLPGAARSLNTQTDELRFDPVNLVVSLCHRFRECSPRIVVSPDPTWGGTRYEFTAGEADRLCTAVLEAAVLIDGQPTPRALREQTRLPYWWSHDLSHPYWCRVKHRDSDDDSDRDCWSLRERTIRPSLREAARTEQPDGAVRVNAVAALQVTLHQRYRECAPRVTLQPEHLADGSTYELTRGEAEQLGLALRAAVLLIDS